MLLYNSIRGQYYKNPLKILQSSLSRGRDGVVLHGGGGNGRRKNQIQPFIICVETEFGELDPLPQLSSSILLWCLRLGNRGLPGRHRWLPLLLLLRVGVLEACVFPKPALEREELVAPVAFVNGVRRHPVPVQLTGCCPGCAANSAREPTNGAGIRINGFRFNSHQPSWFPILTKK